MAIFTEWNGRWRVIMADQEARQCAELKHYDVPKVIAGRSCYNKKGELVEYQP